jgi:hypothetical protein
MPRSHTREARPLRKRREMDTCCCGGVLFVWALEWAFVDMGGLDKWKEAQAHRYGLAIERHPHHAHKPQHKVSIVPHTDTRAKTHKQRTDSSTGLGSAKMLASLYRTTSVGAGGGGGAAAPRPPRPPRPRPRPPRPAPRPPRPPRSGAAAAAAAAAAATAAAMAGGSAAGTEEAASWRSVSVWLSSWVEVVVWHLGGRLDEKKESIGRTYVHGTEGPMLHGWCVCLPYPGRNPGSRPWPCRASWAGGGGPAISVRVAGIGGI